MELRAVFLFRFFCFCFHYQFAEPSNYLDYVTTDGNNFNKSFKIHTHTSFSKIDTIPIQTIEIVPYPEQQGDSPFLQRLYLKFNKIKWVKVARKVALL